MLQSRTMVCTINQELPFHSHCSWTWSMKFSRAFQIRYPINIIEALLGDLDWWVCGLRRDVLFLFLLLCQHARLVRDKRTLLFLFSVFTLSIEKTIFLFVKSSGHLFCNICWTSHHVWVARSELYALRKRLWCLELGEKQNGHIITRTFRM